MSDRPHVRVDPHVMGGSPVIDGTRIPTRTIAATLAKRGVTPDLLCEWYPGLDRASVLLACWFETVHTRNGGREIRPARKSWRKWAHTWRPTDPQCPDPPEVTP